MGNQKEDMEKIVDGLDEQFDAWDKNQKTGAAEKIDEKKDHFCPLCGSKVEKDVDPGQVSSFKDALESKKRSEFSEMEEQVKFIRAFEDAVKDRNDELFVESMRNDFDEKKAEDIVTVVKPMRRPVKKEKPKAVPERITIPNSRWAHETDDMKALEHPSRLRGIEIVHRVPLPGDPLRVVNNPFGDPYPGSKIRKMKTRTLRG